MPVLCFCFCFCFCVLHALHVTVLRHCFVCSNDFNTMGFMKVDETILYSTIWDTGLAELKIFLAAGVLARPHTLREPTPQMDPATDEPTGWMVPPGEYGLARVSATGLVRAANLGAMEPGGMQALQRLGEPEVGSKSQEYDGRRVVRINGGFLVLNLMKYRDCTGAQRQRRFRERQTPTKKIHSHVKE
jgi:hypothetical protein